MPCGPANVRLRHFTIDESRVTLPVPRIEKAAILRETSMLGRTIGRVKAIARRLKRRAVQIAAIGCIAGGAIFGPHDGAAAEKLRVGINLTTIETAPIYL